MARDEADVEQAEKPEYTFDFSSGRLCLDFVNTAGGTRAKPKEHLNAYADLIAWGRQAGVLSDQDAQRLTRGARRRPDEAAQTLAGAVQLRETMFRIFTAATDCKRQHPEDMQVLNAALARALAQVRLETTAEGCVRVWAGDGDQLDRMLWPALRSAMDVLTSAEERSRIHKCESSTCDWLFLDASRNHSRRWCDMKSCGNRAKARRYYERHREHADPHEQPGAG